MNEDVAIKIKELFKVYKLYDKKSDRLKEALSFRRRKYHRDFYALRNINLEVKKGEILGIVGRNGAGKSTLLEIIAGILTPASGQVQVDGNVSALLALGIGFNPERTGVENIYVSGTIKGFTRDDMDKRIPGILDFADIGNFAYQPVKTYSSGMQARLGFAVAVHMDPEILIVDEVLAVGDELFRRKCYAKMEEIFKSGCTVLFVSHTVNTINEICTRAILLDGGEVILNGSPKLVTVYYKKHLFAQSENATKTRNEIVQLNKNEKKKREYAAELEKDEREFTENKSERISKEEQQVPVQKPYFIPRFQPKSTVVIKNYDITIYDFRIKTLEGEDINVLVLNEEYIYSYKVKFGVTVSNINFGMGFKSEKGLALCWMIYPGINQYLGKTFHEGDDYYLKWQFKCLLTPGNYYIDSGIRKLEKGRQVIVNKIADAFVFKVQPVEKKQKGGIFDSIHDLEIKRI